MKFSMNGALTIGTLDGANVELRDEVGAENFFLFGLTAPEGSRLRAARLSPADWSARDAELATVVDWSAAASSRAATPSCSSRCCAACSTTIRSSCFADFAAYLECQRRVGEAYRDRDRWTRMSILNAARTGKFSSDRTIREYCSDIWRIPSVPIKRSSDVSRDSGDASGRPYPCKARKRRHSEVACDETAAERRRRFRLRFGR